MTQNIQNMTLKDKSHVKQRILNSVLHGFYLSEFLPCFPKEKD